MPRSPTAENSREEHLVEVALDRPHLSPSSIKGPKPEGGGPESQPAKADKLVQSLPQAVSGLPVGGRP
jgi:hypothetical protein